MCAGLECANCHGKHYGQLEVFQYFVNDILKFFKKHQFFPLKKGSILFLPVCVCVCILIVFFLSYVCEEGFVSLKYSKLVG